MFKYIFTMSGGSGGAEAGSGQNSDPPDSARNKIVITDPTHVRKLVIKPKDENVSFNSINAVVLSKFLDGVIGTDGPRISTSRQHTEKMRAKFTVLRSGALLIKTIDKAQSAKLMSCKKFGTYDVEVEAPAHMNALRGVVNVQGFSHMTGDEIVEELKEIGVIAARHFRRKSGNEYVNTNTVTLTFMKDKLPDKIKIGYIITDVRVYIPNPRRCYNCFKFGHGTRFCKAEVAKCGHCAQTHESKDCTADESNFKCGACPDGANHSSFDKNCPTYLEQREICTLMANQNISFMEARKLVSPRGPSFATMLKRGVIKETGVQTDCSHQCWCLGYEYTPVPTDKFIVPTKYQNEISVDENNNHDNRPGPSMPVIDSLLNSPHYLQAIGNKSLHSANSTRNRQIMADIHMMNSDLDTAKRDRLQFETETLALSPTFHRNIKLLRGGGSRGCP